MTECTTCLYEYQCDWAEAVPGPCGHYRPDPDHKEPDKPLDRKSQYLKIICGLAETVGLEAYLTLSVLCGGQNLYIPKREALERQARNREIRAHFNGGNYRALAAQYRLSERQIRKIIHLAY